MARVYNFSSGPSMLPEPVLKRAASELLEYGSSGQSVMEMSHRSPEYEEIVASCEELLRETMSIPVNYKVLFMQGGASSQFAMVPMNLLTKSRRADYMVTGMFSQKAYDEAKRYGGINLAASGKGTGFSVIPEWDDVKRDPDADYFHICLNNTIYGSKFPYIPDTGNVPLVADLSSCILSEPFDVSKFGLIYAGAQKNMAPAGLTVVIVRDDLIGKASPGTPTMFDYKVMADSSSLYNTPPSYSIYICKLVLEWLRDEIGGLDAMRERNMKKAAMLYDYIDSSKLFKGIITPSCRSMMNVTFTASDDSLDKEFAAEANKRGMVNLAGHRAVGKLRASIYNAMPVEGVETLINFMREFEKSHG